MNTIPRKGLRGRVLEGMRAARYWRMACGAARVRGCATLLMYHSVPPPSSERFIDPAWRLSPAVFERQLRFMARRCRVVSLTALVNGLSAGRKVEPGTVVITFDDGYLDTLQIAAPILARYGLPATLYLPTAYITDAESQWIDRLYTAFAFRTRDRLTLSDGRTSLASPRERLAAYNVLRDRLRAAAYGERQQVLDDVWRELQPTASMPRLTLTWNDVRQLVRQYPLFEIGGHSIHHADLSGCTSSVLRSEVRGCLKDIRDEIGSAPRHFSFPYGRTTAGARQEVIDAGFESAVCAGGTLSIDGHSDRFAMGRVDPNVAMAEFRFWSSGAFASYLRIDRGAA